MMHTTLVRTSLRLMALLLLSCSLGIAAHVINVTDADFDVEVLKSKKVVIVKFYATWCGHCKNIAPLYEELARNNNNIKFVQVDIMANQQLLGRYNVPGFPAFKIFQNGVLIDTIIGANRVRLEQIVKSLQGN